MKYSLKNYIIAYWKHIRTIQFWAFIWYKFTPKKIRKYFVAVAMIEFHESKIATVVEDELKKAYEFVE